MYRPMTSQTLERKINHALNGEDNALSELVDIVNTQSRITNQRMARLKKEDLDFSSYSRAERAAKELGDDKFHKWQVEDAMMNIEDFLFQARETRLFLSRPHSTVSGAKDRLDEYLTLLEQHRWIKPRENYSEKTQHNLARLMSEGLKDLINTYYENAQDSVEQIATKLDEGSTTYKDAQRLITEILEGKREYEDIFDVL